MDRRSSAFPTFCLRAAAGLSLLFGAPAGAAPDPGASRLTAPVYPRTRATALVETRFGERVADPYRWLENDVRKDPEVADWVERQEAVTRAYLDALPGREVFAGRIRALLDFERFGIPKKAGSRYFYLRNAGLQNQSVLYVRKGLDGAGRVLLDPNRWSTDGTTALDAWEPSSSGKRLAFSVQEGGSDWRTIRFLDVRTAQPLADALEGVKYSGLAWVGDEGVLYSRFPASGTARDFVSTSEGHGVWFHRLGTPQSADLLVYADPAHPKYLHRAQVTSDGHYAVISSVFADNRDEVRVVDLAARGKRRWKPRTLVSGLDHEWRLVDSTGPWLWLITNRGAPRFRLVRADVSRAIPRWVEVIGERPQKLEAGSIVGSQLVLSYLENAATKAIVSDLSGRPARSIALHGIGTAAGFDGKPGDSETFYSFSSFNQPAAIFRLDLATGRSSPFALPRLDFNPGDYKIEQRFYRSKDGTRVPMFVVRSRATATAGKPVPTLLYGYGGFDISLTPGFSAARMAWLQSGGAFALANLRGGGEYGSEWHDAGRLTNKQNVFDDFIAAGEYLIAQGIAPRDGLAIQGGSNGGLLVGAVLNQRPDLFAAANPDVGVMDMLRFDRFTAGRYWVDDYGDPGREADWRVLRAYSPYHNIRKAAYPAVLVTTADTDDRVVPAHSFKYAAALQAAPLGDKPRLIRIESRAGHGSGKPTDKVVEGSADVLAFLAYWSGLDVAR